MMSVNSLSITREMVQAAVVKYNDSQQPYNGLWLSYRQIDHLLDLARQQQRAECVEALERALQVANTTGPPDEYALDEWVRADFDRFILDAVAGTLKVDTG